MKQAQAREYHIVFIDPSIVIVIELAESGKAIKR